MEVSCFVQKVGDSVNNWYTVRPKPGKIFSIDNQQNTIICTADKQLKFCHEMRFKSQKCACSWDCL